MDVFIYLSSGLFLGWSLGGNDAANIFGTAVGSKMLRFKTAALVSCIFVVLGASISGAGAAHTIEKLGAVNEIAGSFMVALSAALTVYWMTNLQLPVSTSQAIVGAIIGWNLFSGSLTDYDSLIKIVSTWIISPLLALCFSFIIYIFMKKTINGLKIHMLKIDQYNRVSFLIIGAFGSYALGANNIANVMGVFVPASPFDAIDLKYFTLTGVEQLFLLGGLAIAAGIYTYSQKVMMTVGSGIVKLSPISGLNVVMSSSLVMFLFASEGLESWLLAHGLPAIPLVPVSSSQVIVGAIVGVGLTQGGRNINFRLLGKIGSGWIITPIAAGLLSFVSLFFLQNVFNQRVYRPVKYVLSLTVLDKLALKNIDLIPMLRLKNIEYNDAASFKHAVQDVFDRVGSSLPGDDLDVVIEYSKVHRLLVDLDKIGFDSRRKWISDKRARLLERLKGKKFKHKWELYDELSGLGDEWKFREDSRQNREYNSELKKRLDIIYRKFSVNE